MRLTNLKEPKGEAPTDSTGILHDYTLHRTDDGFKVKVTPRQNGHDTPLVEFETDDIEDATDYAEAYERAIIRELATTGMEGFIARMRMSRFAQTPVIVPDTLAGQSLEGKAPETRSDYPELNTKYSGPDGTAMAVQATDGTTTPYLARQETIDSLTYQADQAARDALLSNRGELHNDEAAQVIGRFLERSGIGAIEGTFDAYAPAKIQLPLLGKDTHIELGMDQKGQRVWRLHDKQLEQAHKEKSVATYTPPTGELSVASLYTLHSQLEDMAVERGLSIWTEERYFRDMVRAASNLKAEANDITNPNKQLVMPGEKPAPAKEKATPGLVTTVSLGQVKR